MSKKSGVALIKDMIDKGRITKADVLSIGWRLGLIETATLNTYNRAVLAWRTLTKFYVLTKWQSRLIDYSAILLTVLCILSVQYSDKLQQWIASLY